MWGDGSDSLSVFMGKFFLPVHYCEILGGELQDMDEEGLEQRYFEAEERSPSARPYPPIRWTFYAGTQQVPIPGAPCKVIGFRFEASLHFVGFLQV